MMVKIRLVFFFLFVHFYLTAQEQLIESTPKEVTVFLSGAELRYETPYQLRTGQTLLRFVGLSPSVNLNSISLNFGEKIKIISISGNNNMDNTNKNSKKVLFWQDSVRYYHKEISVLSAEIDGLNAEKELLVAYKARIGTTTTISVVELQNYGNFYKTKTKDIYLQVQEHQEKLQKMQEKLVIVQQKLTQAQDEIMRATYELKVLVTTKEAQSGVLKWSYFIENAGWSPNYDLRANGIDKPIQFVYKGNIFNNSGIDWKNVKLALSTADPTQNIVPQYLTKWSLDFESNNYNYYNNNSNVMQQQAQPLLSMENDDVISNTTDIMRVPSELLSEVFVSELSTTFEIKDQYTIPTDNQAYAVEINQYALNADYNYVCTPKLAREAYLLARIAGWESLNLIDGDANIYYNDTYIGKTFISLSKANDTLEVSLGKDKKLIVNRVKKQDYSSKKFMSSTVTETFTYEITVRNTSANPVSLQLKDQVPVAANSEIEVEVLDISKAEYDTSTGLLTWKMSLAGNENRTITISYAIKHPKNKPLTLQRVKNLRQYKK